MSAAIAALPPLMVAKARAVGDCYEWSGCLNSSGYGCVSIGGIVYLVHRAAYAIAVGAIPMGYEVDHLCRNIRCFRPSHLEAVTPEENMRRRAAAYIVCRRGHAMNGGNVRVHRRKNGKTHRECRECALDCQRRSRDRALA